MKVKFLPLSPPCAWWARLMPGTKKPTMAPLLGICRQAGITILCPNGSLGAQNAPGAHQGRSGASRVLCSIYWWCFWRKTNKEAWALSSGLFTGWLISESWAALSWEHDHDSSRPCTERLTTPCRGDLTTFVPKVDYWQHACTSKNPRWRYVLPVSCLEGGNWLDGLGGCPHLGQGKDVSQEALEAAWLCHRLRLTLRQLFALPAPWTQLWTHRVGEKPAASGLPS